MPQLVKRNSSTSPRLDLQFNLLSNGFLGSQSNLVLTIQSTSTPKAEEDKGQK